MKNLLTILSVLCVLAFGSFQNVAYGANEVSVENIEGVSSVTNIIIDWEESRSSVRASGSGIVHVVIMDNKGDILNEGSFFAGGQITFDTSSYPSGTYTIIATHSNGVEYSSSNL